MSDTPRLAPAGKGLPFPENLLARYWFIPMAFRRLPVERAIDLFLGEGKECLRLAQIVSPENRQEPVLIKRFVGIEDSSRYWSINMVIAHLLQVGTSILTLSKQLSEGQKPDILIRIEDLKPQREQSHDLLKQYAEFLSSYREQTEALQYSDLPTHRHPWFGALSAAKWMKLNGIHNRIHRKQIEAILKASSHFGTK